MVDEREYRNVYRAVNPQRCLFEKAVLRRTFGCAKLTKVNIAEREAAGCCDPVAQRRCTALLDRLRHASAFAVHLTRSDGPLPHAKEIKIQCGGLLGLQHVTDGAAARAAGVEDIHGLIDRAVTLFGELDALPYAEIVQSVARFQARARRR
ncbi:MAG: hypothetical protein GWN84_08410 [Gammaproteobacteria bacterium]|nr:hypothetical protein [Gammaproteobacteria bacterium]NIR82893.1 hypothetical protein [Gammaproteobacteria bacterium]NIU04043.1 hypothetical protein [Gammaproteobacteria bacterium]NIX85317.1 hypothetical protein [Gammaproteobacteria bacterium]